MLKKDAQRFVQEQQRRASLGPLYQAPPETFGAFAAGWLERYAVRVRASTLARVRKVLPHLVVFESVMIDEIRPAGIEDHGATQGVRRDRTSQPRPHLTSMQVDVQTEIEINRPRHDVATFAADPDNATAWYENIKSVEWKTAKPLALATQVAFVATFLGRRLAYTYDVTELVPGERLVMSTSDGPFAMETTYTWQDTLHGSTRMTLRNRGEPTGFSKVAAPIMAKAMRRANRNDLTRLKKLLEAARNS